MRLHPYTPFVLVLATALLAFLLPAPAGPMALYAAVIGAALLSGMTKTVAGGALVTLPLWAFLVLLHVVLPGGDGLAAALAQGARLGAVATASLMLLRSFNPSRFLDAASARGSSLSAAFLVVSTLEAAPRLRRRAAMILEAQRARGLRVGGSPAARLRALVPLTLPLVLGTLSDVDDRAMALEIRGFGGGNARTPLDPPATTRRDHLYRWGAVAAVVAAAAWRIA
ncbi:MAG TPA: energy-coupling factor transporter transmembrane component T [Gemmatimonadales bacterium]|nr:energy-coupling factor transporter transmembrane component T [Gemmatimonadales bacterium]